MQSPGGQPGNGKPGILGLRSFGIKEQELHLGPVPWGHSDPHDEK